MDYRLPSLGLIDNRGIGNDHPRALVDELRENHARAICPYCHGFHEHEIEISDPNVFSKPEPAPCTFAEFEYVLHPPWGAMAERVNTSYKIDWQRRSIEAVWKKKYTGHQQNDESKADPKTQVPRRPRVKVPPPRSEGYHVGFEPGIVWEKPFTIINWICWIRDDVQWRFALACSRGDVKSVEASLRTPMKESLLEYRFMQGLNDVALAARLGHASVIEVLCSHKANVDNIDMHGRTPLMEATVWGHVQAVKVLLGHGASPEIKDSEGWNAYSRAMCLPDEARRTDEIANYTITTLLERHQPALGSRHDAHSRSVPKCRLSKSENPGPQAPDDEKWLFHFDRLGTVHTVYVPKKNKTVAYLDRGVAFPLAFFMSGWMHMPVWRDLVFDLCHIIGHKLQPGKLDEPRLPGSFSASHAEKQAIAYYLYNHMVLPRRILGSRPPLNDNTGWWSRDDKAKDIRSLLPQKPVVQAVIRVTQEPCDDCKVFIDDIKGKLGITFDVQVCELVNYWD